MSGWTPDGPLETEKKGPLSIIGDPIGKVAEKGLKPVGALTGNVGEPSGEAALEVKHQAIEEQGGKENPNKPDSEKPGGKRIGGNQQSASNPLGL